MVSSFANLSKSEDLVAPKALFDQQEITHLGSKKSRFCVIAFVWLFESLDEVRASGFDPSKKIKRNVSVLKSPDFIFYERRTPGGGLARCISSIITLKNRKIEILKMTVWFVLES